MNRNHLRSIAISGRQRHADRACIDRICHHRDDARITVTAKQEFQGLSRMSSSWKPAKNCCSLIATHVSTYRVCVGEFKGSVPLKVFADDTQSQVAVGECESVTGKHVRVEPAAAAAAWRSARRAFRRGRYSRPGALTRDARELPRRARASRHQRRRRTAS